MVEKDLNPQPEQNYPWMHGAIVYHIYPRSLQDSNSDGIGDIPGIMLRLDYLDDLGVNAIWLSPFYPSPMADFGYDVADYCDVDPMFGTLEDFKELLARAHKRDMKVIIDLVPNHTSDEHEWFKESKRSRDNSKSDWYIWRDPNDEAEPGSLQPPNNWRDALTGGSAWEWTPEREQYYLHSFDVKQPDLNWSNPEVREAIKDVMRFWLDLGVDGFRVDAVYWMGKDPMMRDDTPNPNYAEGESLLYDALIHDNSSGWPAVYSYLSEMAEVLKEEPYRKAARFMVTEAYPERHNPVAAYMAFYEAMDPRVAAPFNFEGVSLPWDASSWRHFLKEFHSALRNKSNDCIASYAFGNHDQPRIASRLNEDIARSAGVMLLTLPGMSFIYYGEEIGMKDGDVPPEFVQDPAAKGDPLRGRGRDPQRTPMQWSASKNAGFSAGKPWLPVAENYRTHNVDTEGTDPNSFLSIYRMLGKLRNTSDALRHGDIDVLEIDNPDVLGYFRSDGKQTYLTLINFSDSSQEFHSGVKSARLIVSSDPQTGLAEDIGKEVGLRPHEAALFEVEEFLDPLP